MSEEKLRLFVGSFLDEKNAAEISELKNLNQDLSQRWRLRARFVPSAKLHITWFFIGDVSAISLDLLKADFKKTIEAWKTSDANKPFYIKYEAIEVWPSLKSPRVLVFESTEPCAVAESLNAAVTNALSQYTHQNDATQRFKRFRPHLTVCRFSEISSWRETPKEVGQKHKRLITNFKITTDLFPLTQTIDTVSLIQSDLSAGPNGYSSILDISLS